jgi:hypothetical protein
MQRRSIFLTTGLALFAVVAWMPVTSQAAGIEDSLNYLEVGYRHSDFDNLPTSKEAYVRGSVYLESDVSLFFEGAQGSFDNNVGSSDTHSLGRVGVAMNTPMHFGYWQLAGSVASEKYGSGSTDNYGRIEYGAHGRAANGFGWDAALLYNFLDDKVDRKAGLNLGIRYKFTKTFGVVLDGEGYSNDKAYHLGLQWYF